MGFYQYIKRIEKPADIVKQPWLSFERSILAFLYQILNKLVNPREYPEEVNKILLVRRNRLGDAVNILPVIEGLKMCQPDIKVHVLSSKYNSIIFKHSQSVDEVYSIDEKWFLGIITLVFNPVLSRVRSESYDMVIGMGGYSSVLSVLVWRSCGNYSVGPVSRYGSIFDLVYDMRLEESVFGRKTHVDDMARILHKAGLELPETLPYARMSCNVKRHKGWLAICPDAKRAHARYPIDSYGDIIKELLARKIVNKVILLLNDENSEYRALERYGAIRHPANTIDQLVNELSRCQFGILHDGGGAHIAAALGLSILVITGSKHEAVYWKPYARNVKMMLDEESVKNIPPTTFINEVESRLMTAEPETK